MCLVLVYAVTIFSCLQGCLGKEVQPIKVPLAAGGRPKVIASPNYPKDAHDSTVIGWTLETTPDAVITLVCPEIRLFKVSQNPKDCVGNYLGIKEAGKEMLKVCGRMQGYRYQAKTNKVEVRMSTVTGGMRAFRCNVGAVILGPGGGVINIPMKPSVFSAESAEVDSSEHGLVEGEKKTTCPCGWSNKESGRIVGGEETKINEFPFAVALIDREKRFQFCGGAIVTQYHVLTAAHCTDNYLYFGRKISVLVGDHDITKPNDTESFRLIHVDKIVQHSGFEFAFYKYDISLLVLSEKIEFSRFVGPVCLSHSRLNLEKKYVRILGWGKTSMEGPSSPVLKKVDLRIVPLEVCSRHFLHLIPAERKHICTLGTKKGACNGDSGGPVIWLDPETNRYTLVGLVSFGKVCGGPEPTVHTDVTSYWPWIDYYIKATVPEKTCSKVD